MSPTGRTVATVAMGLALVALAACAPADSGGRADAEPVAPVEPAVPVGAAATSEDALRARSAALLAAIRDREIDVIASFIHPIKGVRLSPYAFVEMTEDQVLTAAQFVEALHDALPRVWGVEDGTGDPLSMTCADYMKRFVYDADFVHAEQIAVGRMIGRGNTINNALEVYPAATVVEYHFSGFEPRYEGLDWKSLRLVFEEYAGNWYLVGIIHDQWTS